MSCVKAFRHFLSSDAIALVLTIIYAIITAILAALFKSDSFNLLAYRSFSVNDKSLSYTHVKSEVSGNLNIVITTVYSLVVVLFSSWFRTRHSGRHNEMFCRLVWSVLILIVAIVETNMITNFTKTRMGVLKPHFLAECNPGGGVPSDGWVDQVLTLTICQNKDDIDYRRSFPSGHASQAGVGVAFAVIELQMLGAGGGSGGGGELIPARMIQLLGVMYSITIFALRITNHQHHWADVLVGAILGTVIALTCYHIKETLVKRYQRMSRGEDEGEVLELAERSKSEA